VSQIRALANETIDEGSIIGGILTPGSIADKLADAYRNPVWTRHVAGPAGRPAPVRHQCHQRPGWSAVLWECGVTPEADVRTDELEIARL
jgi:hypothetical protein